MIKEILYILFIIFVFYKSFKSKISNLTFNLLKIMQIFIYISFDYKYILYEKNMQILLYFEVLAEN